MQKIIWFLLIFCTFAAFSLAESQEVTLNCTFEARNFFNSPQSFYTCTVKRFEENTQNATDVKFEGTHISFDKDADNVLCVNIENISMPTIPPKIGYSFTSLEALIIRGASLENVTKNDFEKCNYIQYLDLSHNNLSVLGHELFITMKKLKVLDLSSNKLHEVKENVFKGLGRLDVLNLSHNNLKCIATYLFDPLVELKYVDLSYNLLDGIDDQTFARCIKIERIYLHDNNLTVNLKAFNQTTLKELQVTREPWKCEPGSLQSISHYCTNTIVQQTSSTTSTTFYEDTTLNATENYSRAIKTSSPTVMEDALTQIENFAHEHCNDINYGLIGIIVLQLIIIIILCCARSKSNTPENIYDTPKFSNKTKKGEIPNDFIIDDSNYETFPDSVSNDYQDLNYQQVGDFILVEDNNDVGFTYEEINENKEEEIEMPVYAEVDLSKKKRNAEEI